MSVGHQRHNFSIGVKRVLAYRAASRCSKPDCRASTAGPADAPDKSSNVGEAAHITAASPEGPRYDSTLTQEERQSASNGIWLCRIHAREIDLDVERFSPELLKTWKVHAEDEARAMLGRPLTPSALDVSIEVSLQRDAADGLLVVGETNLPEGTRLMCDLHLAGSPALSGQAKGSVFSRRILFGPFTHKGEPWTQRWYRVRVHAQFRGPWRQPASVLDVIGSGGMNLAGQLAQPLDPDVDETDHAVQGEFECPAPPLRNELVLSEDEISGAIELLRNTVLPVSDAPPSSATVGEAVAVYMQAPGLRERAGWDAKLLAPGLVEVSYSYWDGEKPATALWSVLPRAKEFRYRNRAAKTISWIPREP